MIRCCLIHAKSGRPYSSDFWNIWPPSEREAKGDHQHLSVPTQKWCWTLPLAGHWPELVMWSQPSGLSLVIRFHSSLTLLTSFTVQSLQEKTRTVYWAYKTLSVPNTFLPVIISYGGQMMPISHVGWQSKLSFLRNLFIFKNWVYLKKNINSVPSQTVQHIY